MNVLALDLNTHFSSFSMAGDGLMAIGLGGGRVDGLVVSSSARVVGVGSVIRL